MTRSVASELKSRSSSSRDEDRLFTLSDDLITTFQEVLSRVTALAFPSPLFARDPNAFANRILGVELWGRQREVLEALVDNKRVACKSGHKVGKSRLDATAALWKYCSFPDARVVMTSTTARQVDAILWRELRMLIARSGRCVDCKKRDPEGHFITRPCPHSALIEGDLGDLAQTGLKSVDFREIVGFTARQAEAVAGISGSQLLYIADEASGVADLIFQAIEGNRAGGAQLLMTGNPTKNEGEFFEAFHSKSRFYVSFTISSEETPNVIEGREVIPGLATREWVDEKRDEWGESSPMYLIRVRGEFALGEDGKIFSTDTIMRAEQRWDETDSAGRLFIGVDPAGETGTGDDSALSARRGLKQLVLRVRSGLTAEKHLEWAIEVIRAHALPRETPVLVIDGSGSIGSKLARACRDFLELPENVKAPPFELTVIRASDKAQRQPQNYGTMRDELVANMERWLRDGGAILTDAKLSKEMHCLEWKQDIKQRSKVTPKDQIKKLIGRSPDRFDATALSLWEALSLSANDNSEAPAEEVRAAMTHDERATAAATDNGDDYYSSYKAFR